MEEEELDMKNYIINEIYNEQFDNEEENVDTKKKKKKENEKSSVKLKLEKEDEYTMGTVEDFKDYLNKKYGRTEDIDLKDFIKNLGIESTIDEINREWNIEKEKSQVENLFN